MTILERGRAFLQRPRGLARRTAWDERQCPHYQGHDAWKHGRYQRQLWTLDGRRTLLMQR